MEQERLVYNFNEHGLYYENKFDDKDIQIITLTIDTLQIECDYSTGHILSIVGFLPLIKTIKENIDIPNPIKENFTIMMDEIEYIPGVAYDYFNYYGNSEQYFIKDDIPITRYDEKNKRILIGTQEKNDKYIEINKNILCGIDGDNNLKSLLLLVDMIVSKE